MKEAPRILIFANGEYGTPEFYRRLVQPDDWIYCADGGANMVHSLGLVPHTVVGDLDSLLPEVRVTYSPAETRLLQYPAEKDESDLELTLHTAITACPREILILGALGKRLDHLFANLMLLTVPLRHGIAARIVEEEYEISLVDQELTLQGNPGDTLSLFPLTPEVSGITTRGLRYPLENESLWLGPSRGLSNEFLQGRATITVTGGILLLIQIKKKGL